jgi:hypothetical protein
MTLAQLEFRLSALEKAVEQMQKELHKSAAEKPRIAVEHELTIDLPHAKVPLQGTVTGITAESSELGLSQAEWEELECRNG